MFLYRKQFFAILHFHFSWLNWVRKCCIFFLLYIQYAYISTDLTVSFNGIKQIQQLYLFLHNQFHYFQHFNWFDWNHLFHNFHALSSTIQISTALPFPFSLVLPIPTVLSIPSMPLIWLFSFHQFRQFDKFLLILIQSLVSLIVIILIVADSPNKASQKNQEKFIQLANILHNW